MLMGYSGKIELKKIAVDLRQKGYTYTEIRKIVNVSKDTLSRWCRDITLSDDQIKRISSLQLDGSYRGRLVGSLKMKQRRLSQIANLRNSGVREVGNLAKRERFLIGVALYLGEGYKNDKAFGFTNSDPRLIEFMINWLEEFSPIERDKLYGQIWIHDNNSKDEAIRYWSELTKIPITRFKNTYVVKNKDSRKIRKNIHKYGILAIRASSVVLQRSMLGWMAGILEAEWLK